MEASRVHAGLSSDASPRLAAPTTSTRVVAEGVGAALLLAAIVGSGLMAARLSGGNAALALLGNSAASAVALAVLVFALGPVSGAHLNPLVTLALAVRGAQPRHLVVPYVAAQVTGAISGVPIAHAMFGEPLRRLAATPHDGLGQALGEVVATFVLVVLVLSCDRRRSAAAPLVIGGWIFAAFWLTSSTSFANPAVTLARVLTDTYTGIRPADALGFLAAQAVGAALAVVAFPRFEPGGEAAP